MFVHRGCAALCLVSVKPVKAQRSRVDRIKWLDFMSPYKERFKVAIPGNREAMEIGKVGGPEGDQQPVVVRGSRLVMLRDRG